MTLGRLIARLEAKDPNLILADGFCCPHSYRAYHDCLAFEPQPNTTVAEMLEAARSAVGETFEVYKGGKHKMGLHTEVYLARWGETGEELGETLLAYMLQEKHKPFPEPTD